MEKGTLKYVVVILVVLVVLGLIGLRMMRKVEDMGNAMAQKEMATQFSDTIKGAMGSIEQ